MPFVEQQPNNSQEWSLPDPEATHNQGWSSLDPETRHNLESNQVFVETDAQTHDHDPETRHNLELGQVFVETDARAHDYDRTEEEYNGFHGKNLAAKQNEHPVASTEFSEDGQTNSEYVDSLAAEPVHEQAVNHEVSIESRPISTAEVATNSLVAYGKGIGELRNGVVEQNRKR